MYPLPLTQNFKGRASDWLNFHMKDELYHAIDSEAAYSLDEDGEGSSFVKKCTSITNVPKCDTKLHGTDAFSEATSRLVLRDY